MIAGIIKWLKDRQGNVVVPKTLAKCVFTEGGNNLQNLSSRTLYKGTGGVITQLPSVNPVMIISDLNYSTEEQLTGKRWIDGKPIYQITFLGNEITIPNIDTCFVLFSMAYSPTYNNYDVIPMSEYLCRWSYSKANSKLTLFDNTGFHSEYFTTIQYTKTTDTASSPVNIPTLPEIDFSHSSVSSIYELLQRLANDIYPKTKTVLIPTMTSDTQPYGIVSTNYTYPGRYAWYGLRHDLDPDLANGQSFYYAGEPSDGNYLQYEFREISSVSEIKLKAWGTLSNNQLKISYINENDELIDVNESLTFSIQSNTFIDVSYSFGEPVNAKAIRITSKNGNAGLAMAQLQAYGE